MDENNNSMDINKAYKEIYKNLDTFGDKNTFKSAFKSVFKDIGIDNTTISKFTDTINNAATCDAECENNNKVYENYIKLMNSLEELNKGENNFEASFKNYYISKNGKNKYCTFIKEKADDAYKKFYESEKKNNDEFVSYISSMIDSYSYNKYYLDNINNTFDNSKESIKSLNNNIDNYTNHVNLDNRSNFFESKNISDLRNYNFYIVIIYYIIAIIFLIITNYFKNFKLSSKIYDNFNLNNLLFSVLLIIILCMPYFVKHFIILVVNLFIKFLEFMNIQPFPQTYKDILLDNK